ncbi:hypothetical protein HUU59_11835 [bacterium]|nr:hypothetical protein [bacterium]
MRYSDLTEKTKNLAPGKHIIGEYGTGRVIIHNVGTRHHYMSPRPEYRLIIETGGKSYSPRHSDFLTDYLLKCECRPELRLALSEACDAVCNGAGPSELKESGKLPPHFSEVSDATWTYQTSNFQTGGLSTELFLNGLQALIRVYDLNDPELKAPEAFRKAFLDVQGGKSVAEASQRLRPQIRGGKRYFDRLERA